MVMTFLPWLIPLLISGILPNHTTESHILMELLSMAESEPTRLALLQTKKMPVPTTFNSWQSQTRVAWLDMMAS